MFGENYLCTNIALSSDFVQSWLLKSIILWHNIIPTSFYIRFLVNNDKFQIPIFLVLLNVFYPFKFFKADGLFSKIAPTVEHLSKFEHSPQVATLFFNAHWRIPQILSQNTVLIPSTRQPWQLICSGRIGVLFNSVHSFAVFFRKSWSSLIVAK